LRWIVVAVVVWTGTTLLRAAGSAAPERGAADPD
jgi:hypothetical protein